MLPRRFVPGGWVPVPGYVSRGGGVSWPHEKATLRIIAPSIDRAWPPLKIYHPLRRNADLPFGSLYRGPKPGNPSRAQNV